jgi:DNA repair protein RadA
LSQIRIASKSKTVIDTCGKALYVDTENTFRPNRLQQIAENRELDAEEVLRNVLVAKVTCVKHFEILINQLGWLITRNQISLIIVDSLIALYRAKFSVGSIYERQQKLNRILSTLRKIAESSIP